MTVINRHNFHLFKPLLYQVATATLSPADISAPIRELFRDQPNARVLTGRVTNVQCDENYAVLEDERTLTCDHLVIATGARHSYFGNESWEPFGPDLKNSEDATDVRRHILLAFERAENEENTSRCEGLKTFAVVGGGPTGVELAGAIAELADHGMGGALHNVPPETARVILVQSGDRLLPAFPESLSAATKHELEDIGVEVMTGTRVRDTDEDGLSIGEERIEVGTVVWAAGVIASAAGRWLDTERAKAGRIIVGADLTIEGADNISVVGDTTSSDVWNGNPLLGLAPAAKQGGTYDTSVIAAKLSAKPVPGPFQYKKDGSLAVGRQ